MTVLKLTSSRETSLRPLVEAALQNELRILHAGIRRTEQRVQAFEAQYQMASAEFLRRYENDELPETLDLAEWIGEQRMLTRLREKAATLQEIQFAN